MTYKQSRARGRKILKLSIQHPTASNDELAAIVGCERGVANKYRQKRTHYICDGCGMIFPLVTQNRRCCSLECRPSHKSNQVKVDAKAEARKRYEESMR